MAFNDQEKQLIIYGKTNGKSQQEVEQALVRLRTGQGPVKPAIQPATQPNLLQRVSSSISDTGAQNQQILKEGTQAGDTSLLHNTEVGTHLAANTAGGVLGTLNEVLKSIPGVDTAEKAVSGVANTGYKAIVDKLASTNLFKEASKYPDLTKELEQFLSISSNTGAISGDILAADQGAGLLNKGADVAKNTINKVGEAADSIKLPGVPTIAKNIGKDIAPTADRIVNDQVTKALNLTQGDVKNINLSTGNEPGQFLAKNNLIGNNLEETVKNVNNFYKTNYDAVRAEIGKVKDAFTPDEVPRFKEALTAIKQQISEVPGMQQANTEVDNLLGRKTVSLNDVQKVKELMDDHFSLYRAVGDVKEGVAKEGLANIRTDLKKFIETKVKDATGSDIKELNNNVMTARSIEDAAKARSTRGLTRSNVSLGDMGTFFATTGAFGGNPLAGVAAVLIKKGLSSPTFKLRFSKWLDGLSDAQKASAEKEIQTGKIPQDVEAMLEDTPGFIENAKKAIQTIKTQGQRGFVTNPFKEGLPKEVKSLNTEDKSLMTKYIDSVRVKNGPKLTNSEENDLVKLNETLGIHPDQSAETIAKQYEQVIPNIKNPQPRTEQGKYDKKP